MKHYLINVLKSQALSANRCVGIVLIQQEQFWTPGGAICPIRWLNELSDNIWMMYEKHTNQARLDTSHREKNAQILLNRP